MNFYPEKLFIGLMDFFSILLLGALITYLHMGDVGLAVLEARYMPPIATTAFFGCKSFGISVVRACCEFGWNYSFGERACAISSERLTPGVSGRQHQSPKHVIARTLMATALPLSVANTSAQCPLTQESTFAHAEIGPVKIFRDAQTQAIAFASQMQVNTDGAPDSYHPDDIGITHICNGVSIGSACTWKPQCLPEFRHAKAQGFKGPQKICFFAMATDARGVPIIQGPDDPKPGYFVSTTALHQPGASVRTPQAQLDSNTVPFAVIPGSWQTSKKPGPQLGDVGVAYRRSTGQTAFFVIGDTGPRNKLGEVMKFVRQQPENHSDSSTSLRSRS